MRVGTAQDVAELLHVSIDKVYELAQQGPDDGGLPSLRRIGPRLRFDLDDVEQWMRSEQPAERQA
jgi:excisionase family DNA binding protein